MDKVLTIEQVEDLIESYIDGMKLEVKNRFVYIFRDFDIDSSPRLYGQSSKDGERRYLYGICDPRNSPPLITFFPNAMVLYKLPEEQIKEVVNHEILHTFYQMTSVTDGGHKDIDKREANVNFNGQAEGFQDNG